ncbi:hypothetical protein [Maribacter sp. 2308TA10-17]|uniref:hypothetical protein n=1 Tax=Maribacter sp. 2308TA10-17 TaxID=3386276 RepID=UPI0039BC87D4
MNGNHEIISKYNYDKKDLLKNLKCLIKMHKEGRLGGETMPLDAKPSLIRPDSKENYHFLTLPMALNYQRDSYKLWESARDTYLDSETNTVFHPEKVLGYSSSELKDNLLKYKLALRPNKHVDTWQRLCEVIAEKYDSDIRNLFLSNNNDILLIKEVLEKKEKKRFPFLSGPKILNYWLHVLDIYTPIQFINKNAILIAPDTHIIKASLKLGIISGGFEMIAQNRNRVSKIWDDTLHESGISPREVQTPLWLWSKGGFKKIE